jgi:ornithine lipid hydroxylase
MPASRGWPSFHYPVVVLLAFAQFTLLRQLGWPLTLATYVPIVVTAVLVAALEAAYPARPGWRPSADELRVDAMFLVLVQLVLPPLVALLFTTAVVDPVRALGIPAAFLWPHAWPVALQAVLMVLLVDLMRYWLHRLAHETDLLWRLHAVHHSVDRLYWLNTSRFHPVEKSLQMCLDSLPFLLMQVEPTVLSLYYLAYATNGFFQHSNIDMRYGVLNLVVSSAEAHRWHHSREPREANSNYGSTTIVWDRLFGTFFLPEARSVGDVGLHDRSFPRAFWAQVRAPFRRR